MVTAIVYLLGLTVVTLSVFYCTWKWPDWMQHLDRIIMDEDED